MGNAAARDTLAYRQGYPAKKGMDDVDATSNLLFYRNQLPSRHRGALIEEILTKWRGDYSLLERHHGFIQWLFPVREQSAFSAEAQELQPHEARAIREDPVCLDRVLRAYELMLDFYGWRLASRESGEVARSEHYAERFRNLVNNQHNWLRVSRILKSLGEFGLERYKLPWLLAINHEVFESKLLAQCRGSYLSFWAFTLRRKEDLERLKAEVSRFFPEAEKMELAE